jgi:hypothetical protein
MHITLNFKITHNTMTTNNNPILCFHIGRGGQFNNGGFLRSLVGKNINDYIDHASSDLYLVFENKTEVINNYRKTHNVQQAANMVDYLQSVTAFLAAPLEQFLCTVQDLYGITPQELGELIYVDGSGKSVGLTYAEALTGVGRINEDNEYDTTYCKRLDDCDEKELKVAAESGHYFGDDLERLYIKLAEISAPAEATGSKTDGPEYTFTTKGPWKACRDYNDKTRFSIDTDNPQAPYIAESIESLADAALISAAPDMLAALLREDVVTALRNDAKRLMREAEVFRGQREYEKESICRKHWAMRLEAIKHIEAAIKKATTLPNPLIMYKYIETQVVDRRTGKIETVVAATDNSLCITPDQGSPRGD